MTAANVRPAAGPLERPRQCRWRPGRRLLYPDWNYLASKHLLPVSKAQRPGSGRARRGRGYRPRIVASSASSPRLRASRVRRRARTAGSATTKIFTSASGQITVPISRPSSTAPGGFAANWRWNSTNASRTRGMAETTEAACRPRGTSGLDCRRFRDRAPRGADRGGLILQVGSGADQRMGHRAIDHPGVEMAQP